MEIVIKVHEKMGNVSENVFFNLYFLNVNIFLAIKVIIFNLYILIENIAVEGTVSRFYINVLVRFL